MSGVLAAHLLYTEFLVESLRLLSISTGSASCHNNGFDGSSVDEEENLPRSLQRSPHARAASVTAGSVARLSD
jgi:hypothetical protein